MANFPITYSSLPINDLPEPSFKQLEVNYPDEPRRKVLQLSSCAGGFTYSGCDNFHDLALRSRFIIWRYDESRLELIEYSTDCNLEGNALRLDFINCQLVGRVCIFECEDFASIHLVIPTSTRIIRLILPHPFTLPKIHSSERKSVSSIFQNVTKHILAETSNSYSLPQAFLSTTLVAIATSLIDDRVVCAMGCSDGSVYGLRFPTPRGEHFFSTFELKRTGIMSRILSGFMPTAMRKSEIFSEENTLTSLRMVAFEERTYLLQLFRDCKLKLLCMDSQECLLAEDLSSHLHSQVDSSAQIEPAIEINKSLTDGTQKLVILIANNTLAVFITFDLHLDIATPILQHISTKFSTLPGKSKLIQFSLSQDTISTLWLSQDEFPIVQTCHTEGKTASGNWITNYEPSPLPNELEVPPIKDIQETYLTCICNRKNMDLRSIIKALSLFNCNPTQILTHASLKTAIIQAVEKEIHHLMTLPHLQSQSRRDLQTQVWSRFYQACLQYQAISCYPLGLLYERGVYFMIGKRSLVLYRPIQLLEQMYDLPTVSPSLEATRILSPSLTEMISSVISKAKKLTNCFVCLDLYLKDLLDNDVDLIGFIGYLLDCMLIADREVCKSDSPALHSQLRSGLAKVRLLVPAFQAISDLLKLPIPDSLYANTSTASEEELVKTEPAFASLFTSDLGVSILNMYFRDSISKKKEICWSVLLLACFILREKDTNAHSMQSDAFDVMKNSIIPDLISSLISFHLMQNLSEFYSTISDTNNAFYSIKYDIPNIPISESVSRIIPLQFISSKCTRDVQYKLHTRKVIPIDETQQLLPCLTYILSEYINSVSELLAPGLHVIKLLSFMLEHRHLTELLYTLHVLESLYNPVLEYPIRYFKAQYYLKVGRVEKSTQHFLSTIAGLLSANPDPFLFQLVSDKVEETGSNRTVLYCLTLIDLFEQEQCPDMIIHIAKHALQIAPAGDTLISNLWSIQFKHSLDLFLYEDAYVAMLNNPEQSRRKDCMKRFVIELCNRKKFKMLCTFTYSGMERDIEDVLESRARSIDVMTGNYYSLLHSFYTHRGNYRRAAVAMYECAMRLSGELPTLSILNKQAKCYLATINALHLVEEKSAFVVKPPPPEDEKKKAPNEPPNSKKKRDEHDDDSRDEESILTTRVKVMSIKDVENEYLIVLAQLKLAEVEETATPLTTSSCSHEEILMLLVEYGLFDMAMTLSGRLKLSRKHLFESLTTRCVKMSRMGDELLENEEGIAYTEWLLYNDVGVNCCADVLPPEKQAWELLKRYLESEPKYDKIESLCWTVARSLALNFALPQWLKDEICRMAPEKLLCLYLKYSELENAGELAIEYIRAVMGDKKENELRLAQEKFGLKFSLKTIDPETGTYNQVKLPYNYIDFLLSELKAMPEDSHLNALYEALDLQLQEYSVELEQASDYLIFLKKRSNTATGIPPHLQTV